MQTYSALVKLAGICARRAHFTANREVAGELWRMALEYQYKAAQEYFLSGHARRCALGKLPGYRPADQHGSTKNSRLRCRRMTGTAAG